MPTHWQHLSRQALPGDLRMGIPQSVPRRDGPERIVDPHLRQRRRTGSMGRDRPALRRQGLRLELLRRLPCDRIERAMRIFRHEPDLRVRPRGMQFDHGRRVHPEWRLAIDVYRDLLFRGLHVRHDLDDEELRRHVEPVDIRQWIGCGNRTRIWTERKQHRPLLRQLRQQPDSANFV